MLAQVLAH